MAKKTVKVEFELTEDQVKQLIQAGTKGPRRITTAEIRRMAEEGAIRASDFLDPDQQALVIGKIAKLAAKAAGKVKDKLSDKTTQRVVVTEAVDIVADIVSTGQPARRRPKPKG